MEQSRSKEQAILAAAAQEFMTKGFDGARTISIAKAAGVTHAMLHYYFRSKENIFERIFDEKMRLLSQSVLEAFEQQGLSLEERLRKGIESHFDYIAKYPGLPRFVVNEVMSRPERHEMMQRRIGPMFESITKGLQRELDEAADRGECERMDVRMLMLDIVSLNVFSFIAMPIIEPLVGDLAVDRETFCRLRKQENVEVIMRRLKKL